MESEGGSEDGVGCPHLGDSCMPEHMPEQMPREEGGEEQGAGEESGGEAGDGADEESGLLDVPQRTYTHPVCATPITTHCTAVVKECNAARPSTQTSKLTRDHTSPCLRQRQQNTVHSPCLD